MNSRAIRLIPTLIVAGLVLAFLFALAAFAAPAAAGSPRQSSPDGLWSDVPEASISPQGNRLIVPDRYRTLRLDPNALQPLLDAAPLEFTLADPAVISLPLPDGSFARFHFVSSPIMAPELAARYPDILTFSGRGIDDPNAVTRFDFTPHGFHAMILSPSGAVFIDPFSQNDATHYISYSRSDLSRPSAFVESGPLGDNAEVQALLAEAQASGTPLTTGPELRTYRLAMAATGEYTIFHGGTVPDALAEIVTAMNRVNGIYEADVAVRMELVANTDDVIYTDPNTDPYTNNNGGAMLGQNQTTLDSVIGSANYDIGHVFSTGGGGIAFLQAVCNNNNKARGVTGLSSPTGDPFYVDYVSHEIGHQFGGNHTFNGNAGSCAGGNRNASTAWEPGSGTTIMAYAGICGSQNIQPNSDDHFHTGSIDEIVAFTTLGSGNSCAVVTNTGNSAPDANAGPDFTIPLNTPFTLTGSATDPDSDPLTYNWEEFDLGPAGHPDTPSGNAPIFRSFSSSSSPSRTFPQISDIVNNAHTLGELLPSYARTLNFRFTVRDNHLAPSAGGVDTDLALVTVADSAGPFLVTHPNTPTTWDTGSLQSVSWDVANTTASPVSCASVDIRLSTDGGFTFPVLVETAVPNDGSEQILVPNQPSTTARIQVACSGNIFFDISNTNFTIEEGGGPTPTPTVTPTATNTPDPSANAHIGDLDGSGQSQTGGRWTANVTITVHDGNENLVANALVSGSWSNGTSGSGACTTNGSGQCTVSKTNIHGSVNSVDFSVTSVSAGGLSYNPGANHDPDGDSNGTAITVSQFGPPTATPTMGPTPTPTNTPEPGATVHIGDLDGSSAPGSRNNWDATVTVTVHDITENPIANALVSGSWSNGTSGSGACTTNGSGQCSISKTGISGATGSVDFSVTNVSAGGFSYNPGANHDPDGDSDGTTVTVFKDGPPGPTPTPTNTPEPGASLHIGDLDGEGTAISPNQWTATVTVTVHDGGENPIANATVFGSWSNGASGLGICTTNSLGLCQVSVDRRSTTGSVDFSVDNVTLGGFTYDSGANHDPDPDSDGTTITVFSPF